MLKPGCVFACIMHSCACACMHVRMCACMHCCMHAWLHLVCAHGCRCIHVSFATVWIHVPLQMCFLPLMYVCPVHFDTFCLLCLVSYLEYACCYFVFPCNRCNKEHFEFELEMYQTTINTDIYRSQKKNTELTSRDWPTPDRCKTSRDVSSVVQYFFWIRCKLIFSRSTSATILLRLIHSSKCHRHRKDVSNII